MTDGATPPDDGVPSNVADVHRIVIGDLFRAQQTILTSFQNTQAMSYSGAIYHYTSDVGLYQIVKSGRLWMSDYSTLNDPSEIKYGLDAGLTVLEDEWNKRGRPVLLTIFVNHFKKVAANGLPNFLRAFVLSMSAAPNELTQWRSYGDNATGYCLGFDSGLLDQAFIQFSAPYRHGSGSFLVQYDPVLLRRLLNSFVVNAVNTILSLGSGSRMQVSAALSAISVNLLFSMIYVSLHFKHEAYKSEQEYRYVIVTAPRQHVPGLDQRARRDQLIDYLSLDWKVSYARSLQSVRVGPAGDFVDAQKFIDETMLLHLPRGLTYVVDQSDIPFRA